MTRAHRHARCTEQYGHTLTCPVDGNRLVGLSRSTNHLILFVPCAVDGESDDECEWVATSRRTRCYVPNVGAPSDVEHTSIEGEQSECCEVSLQGPPRTTARPLLFTALCYSKTFAPNDNVHAVGEIAVQTRAKRNAKASI